MRSLWIGVFVTAAAILGGCSATYQEPAAGYYYNNTPGYYAGTNYYYYDRYPHYYQRNYYSNPSVRVQIEHRDAERRREIERREAWRYEHDRDDHRGWANER